MIGSNELDMDSQSVMTKKEELIQSIQRSPDEVVSALWERLQELQQSLSEASNTQEDSKGSKCSQRLHRKQGVLVIETGASSQLDIKGLVDEIREERIQKQIGDLN